jgi:hypothetical protein
MSLLYLTLSPTSPFGPDPPAFNTTLASSPQPLTLPQPDRSWINWNSGRLFDPPLIGYLPLPPSDDIQADSPQPNEQGALHALSPFQILRTALFDKWEDRTSRAAGSSAQGSLPQGYVDLRWKKPGKFEGMGYVFDFGWRRTEQGLRWEGETGQLPLPVVTPSSAADGESAVDEQEVAPRAAESSTLEGEDTAGGSASQVGPRTGEEIASGKGYRWSRIPFVGDL